MAIVKMKRLRLMAMRPDQEELLKLLQRMGCVEIDQPQADLSDPQWAGLTRPDTAALNEARDAGAAATAALAALKQYAPVKSALLHSRPIVPEQRFFDDGAYASALEAAGAINSAQRAIQSLYTEQSKLGAQKAALAPWLSLDVPLDAPSTQEVRIQFGTIPARASLEEFTAALAAAAPLAQVIPASSDQDAHYLLLLCHGSQGEAAGEVEREFSFSPAALKGWSGTAADNDKAVDGQLERIAAQLEAEKADILARADRKGDLELCLDRAEQELRRQEAKSCLLDTDATFYLDGWVPAEEVERLASALASYVCAWETADPAPEEYPQVPVKLKNNWFTRPLSMVTDMYSLPAYNGVDPNPLMAPFFILFYGFMMADMGYGLVMMLVAAIVIKKTRPKGPTVRNMFPLLFLCGVSTFLWGAATGGFFGDMLPQLAQMLDPNTTFTAMPALFSPLEDALAVLIGSLALGVVQIFTGMAINMYKQIKRGEVMAALCNEGAWYVIFLCLIVGIVSGRLTAALIAVLVVVVLTQGYGKKGIGGKLMGIGGSLYNNITGYFSDILSYSRLMALMLAGAVIAQVFNTLGGITGNVITFFLISFVGNALNFALNILGCFVHDMRLQCLEYFNRFYEDGGKPFQPLEINPKRVDIQEQ